MIAPTRSASVGSAPKPAQQSEREQLAAASQAFEAIFVRQMLSAARKTDFGDSLLGGQALDTFRQMQDDRFADIAAERGAFGFAKIIEAQLSVHLSHSQPFPQTGRESASPSGRGF